MQGVPLAAQCQHLTKQAKVPVTIWTRVYVWGGRQSLLPLTSLWGVTLGAREAAM